MKIQLVQPSPDLCRFADGVFDRVIGTEVPLTIEGTRTGKAKILNAQVIEGGYAVRLDLEVPDEVMSFARVDLPSFTIEQSRNKGS